ncbi:MAG: sulfatase-like hydrolase/transferase, partial [Bryobacteraceae bacterium]
TPQIDGLASGGTVFSEVSAQTPLTLPSHASLFTSRLPQSIGISDNGDRLPSKIPTLASILKGKGYRTAAFVGAFVIDRRFGLNEGFDVYESPFQLRQEGGVDPGDIKRAGSDVIASATRWLDDNADSQFFLFVHLYDLHTPRPHGGTYESELKQVDASVGGFLRYLTRKGLYRKSIVVFTSDHGEGLGEHGESTHGYYLYQSTLRVPLVIHWPDGMRGVGARVNVPVSLLDVTPTILDSTGNSSVSGMVGHSLRNPAAAAEIYSESHYASRHFGCAVLRSLRVGRHKYIEAPNPELYDLSIDPGEKNNIFDQNRRIAGALKERLSRLRRRATSGTPVSTTPSPEVIAALRSLGYLSGGGSSNSSEGGPDPKTRIADFERYGEALTDMDRRPAKALKELEALSLKLPDVPDLRIALGLGQQKQGRHADAAATIRQALQLNPSNALAHFNLAVSLFRLQQLNEAAKEAQAALALAPWYSRAEELMANIRFAQKDYAGAQSSFERLLAADPQSFVAHFNLGVLAASGKQWEKAENHLNSCLKINPNAAEAYNALGSVYLQQGYVDKARSALERAIRLKPDFAWAHYNLGLAFEREQRVQEALRNYRQALTADPRFAAARIALERLEKVTE